MDIFDKLKHYNDAYRQGRPEISDDEFDELENEAYEIDPDNKYFNIIGSDSKAKKDIKHKVPMLSMNKIKDLSLLSKWYINNKLNFNEKVIIGPKIDGISGSIHYINGKINFGNTRGDGIFGKIIPFIGKSKVYGIPNRINDYNEIEIRGEFYVDKKFQDHYRGQPLRNICYGIINSEKNIKYLSFIAYQIIGYNSDSEFNKLKYINRLGFNNILRYTHVISNIKNVKNIYDEYINSYRNGYEFETDGIVLTVDSIDKQNFIDSNKIVNKYHHYNLAIKPPAKGAYTKLIDIKENIGKNGKWIPIGIVKPVKIGNVVISKATLNNYDYLRSFGNIKLGSKVYIVKANDVIPQIISIHSSGNGKPYTIPKNCPFCNKPLYIDSSTDVSNLVCTNTKCNGKLISLINSWINKIGIKYLGGSTIEKLVNNGYITSILDLYTSDFMMKLSKLESFVEGGSRILKIIKSINDTKKNLTDMDLISCIGIHSIGRRKIKSLGLNNIDTMKSDLLKLKDSAAKNVILEWLSEDNNYQLLKTLKKIIGTKPVDLNSNINGLNICVTGSFDISRKDIIDDLMNRGYNIQNSVNNNTNILLAGNGCDNNSKYKKAMSLKNIKIVRNLNDL